VNLYACHEIVVVQVTDVAIPSPMFMLALAVVDPATPFPTKNPFASVPKTDAFPLLPIAGRI
jgi:hypothetical protein